MSSVAFSASVGRVLDPENIVANIKDSIKKLTPGAKEFLVVDLLPSGNPAFFLHESALQPILVGCLSQSCHSRFPPVNLHP
jgi:hypothetical protein